MGLDYRGDLFEARLLAAKAAVALCRGYGWGALYVRNVYDFDCGEGTSFCYVVRDWAMEIGVYPSKKDRQQIRRSLKAREFGLKQNRIHVKQA